MLQPTRPHYYRKLKRCNKLACRTCQERGGHGPYWFESHTGPTGKTVEVYIGKQLPFEIQLERAMGRKHAHPIIGRTRELELLEKRLSLVPRKTRKRAAPMPAQAWALFLLTGDAGIGKTRLAEETARIALVQGWQVVWGRAYAHPHEAAIPYHIWAEMLHQVLEQASLAPQALLLTPTQVALLRTLLPPLQTLLPAEQTGVVFPEQEPVTFWETIFQLLTQLSKHQPLLFILDDLQWADHRSGELLAYLVRRTHGENVPILFLGTCRMSELAEDHPLCLALPDLQREHRMDLLPIARLSDGEISDLLASLQLPIPLIQRIATRAAGNPFFAEALAHNLSGNDQKAAGSTALPSQLPDSIQAVLRLRLAEVSTGCVDVLSLAAVLGAAFTADLLAAVVHALAPQEPVISIEQFLQEGVRVGLLTEEQTNAHEIYHFWHPLVADMLYEQIAPPQRAFYHETIAHLLQTEMATGKSVEAATIVRHLRAGSGAAASVDLANFAELAGDHAYRLSAYAEAVQYYRLALEHWRQLPTDIHATSQEHEGWLLERLGECTRCEGKYEEAREWYTQALAVVPQQQAAHRRALLWCEVGFTWYSSGKLTEASACYRQSEQTLDLAGIEDGPAWAYIRYRQSYVSWRKGAYEQSLRLANEALQRQEHALVALPPGEVSPVFTGRIHQLLGLIAHGAGRYQETATHWKAALAIFERYESRRDIAVVNCNLGDIYLRQANFPEAQACLHQALTIAEQIGESPLASMALGNLGLLAMRRGILPEAEAWVQRGIVCARQTNDAIHLTILYACLARIQVDQGKLPEATVHAAHALAYARSLRIPPCLGVALVALGTVRLARAEMRAKEVPLALAMKRQLFHRAAHSFQHALGLQDIEAETRIEALLFLAQAHTSLEETDRALEEATRALEEATHADFLWLTAHAHQILASILVAQGQRQPALQHYQQALEIWEKTGMDHEQTQTHKAYRQTLKKQLAETSQRSPRQEA